MKRFFLWALGGLGLLVGALGLVGMAIDSPDVQPLTGGPAMS